MNFKGEMFGQPFEGLQLIGFDNMQQKYVTLWIDNSSTFFFMTTGTRQEMSSANPASGPTPLTGAQAAGESQDHLGQRRRICL